MLILCLKEHVQRYRQMQFLIEPDNVAAVVAVRKYFNLC